MPDVRLLYYCAFAQQNGYARAAHDYCVALHRAGVDLAIRPLYDCDPANLDEQYAELLPLATKEMLNPTHAIVHAMPLEAVKFASAIPSEVTHRICVTTWETDRVPDEIVDSLTESFGRIIVPSHGVQKAFEAGYPLAVVIPHCFDDYLWVPGEDDDDYDDYTFYTVDAHTTRKNLKGLVSAYLTAFEREDSVALRILATHNGSDVSDMVAMVMDVSGIDTENLPAIYVHDPEYLSLHGLVAFHQAGDCYVTASRGEGFGLGPCEARLVGNYLIAPFYDAYYQRRPYNGEAYAVVGRSETPAIAYPEFAWRYVGGKRYPALRETKPNGIDGTQMWLEPHLDDLQYQMIKASDNREHRRDNTLTDRLRDDLSYHAIGATFKQLLEEQA